MLYLLSHIFQLLLCYEISHVLGVLLTLSYMVLILLVHILLLYLFFLISQS